MLKRTPAALVLSLVALAAAASVSLSIAACTSAAPASSATVQVVMNEIAFAPLTVSAHVGDTIEWVNKDIVAHTATSTTKEFRVVVEPGEKGRAVMKTAGTFDYFCEYHPNMKGTVTVTKAP